MSDAYTGTSSHVHIWEVADIQGSSVLWKCLTCKEELWKERTPEPEKK